MHDHHPLCPVCDGAVGNKYAVNGYTIAKCRSCGFQFVREIVTDEELAVHYSTPLRNPIYNDADNNANLAFYYQRLRVEIEARVQKGRVLDVGCSSGQFLDVMEGWHRYGTEIGVEADDAIRKYGDRVRASLVEQCDWPSGFFDVITMQDSFDHMPRPMDVLRKCAEFLRPGGLLVIKVHDISSLFARVSGRRYYALIPPSHLSYFGPKSLKLALAKTGFSAGSVKYLPHVLFLRTIPFRLSRNNESSVFYRWFEALNRNRIGRIRIRKNLFDIMTVFATRN
jgi:SAM-dependent methyltransferase